MIVPTNRLILWAGIVLIPFAALVGAVSTFAALLITGLVGIFFCLVITDAILASGRLEGISVELPDIIRLSKGRQTEITIRIYNDKRIIREIRIGLPFPQEMLFTDRDMTVELPGDSKLSSISWPCRAIERGKALLERCYLEASSLLGFWTCRGSVPIHTEIRVYPDLFRENKDLNFLFQNRGIGIHSQRRIGKGRDFEQLREYIPGDSYEDIHWKATAKRRYPVTKVFQIERTQDIYIIIDASRLSNRRTAEKRNHDHIGHDPGTTIMERYITAALIMGLVTERMGDLFGFMAFSNNIDRFIRAKRGKSHFNACREALYSLQARMISPDFSELITFISMKIRRRSLLIFLTNLDDPVFADSFIGNIDILAKKHLVMVNMLNPGKARPLFVSSQVRSINGIYRDLGRHIMWDHLHDTEKRLRKRGIGFLLLDNERIHAQLAYQYLNVKQKQIL